MCGYEWPGNVRQLENTVERAVALETTRRTARGTARRAPQGASGCGRRRSSGRSPRSAPGAVLPDGLDMEKYVAQIERSLLQAALAQSNGVQTKAADCWGFLTARSGI